MAKLFLLIYKNCLYCRNTQKQSFLTSAVDINQHSERETFCIVFRLTQHRTHLRKVFVGVKKGRQDFRRTISRSRTEEKRDTRRNDGDNRR